MPISPSTLPVSSCRPTYHVAPPHHLEIYLMYTAQLFQELLSTQLVSLPLQDRAQRYLQPERQGADKHIQHP